MSCNLYKILDLENDLTDFFYQGKDKLSIEVQEIVSKMEKLLVKLNNKEILYLLKNGTSIHDVLDIVIYLKKYRINKKEINHDNSYKEELKKLNNFIQMVSDASLNENEYMYICMKCDVDNVANYLLSHMSNEDIMILSQESDDWNYKLFLYGNLKA